MGVHDLTVRKGRAHRWRRGHQWYGWMGWCRPTVNWLAKCQPARLCSYCAHGITWLADELFHSECSEFLNEPWFEPPVFHRSAAVDDCCSAYEPAHHYLLLATSDTIRNDPLPIPNHWFLTIRNPPFLIDELTNQYCWGHYCWPQYQHLLTIIEC